MCARCLRGQVRKRGHSRISRRDPPLLYIYINRDNRASVTGQWAGLRPRISFVGSRRRDVARSITMRARSAMGIRARERISESQEKAYPLHLASVNCRRYLPFVPRVRDIVGAHLRIRRFLFSRDPCLSICSPGFLRNSMGSRGETFEKKRMFVPLLLIFLLVLLKNEKLQNRVDEI